MDAALGLEASLFIGAVVVGPDADAQVELGAWQGTGFRLSVVVEASSECVAQPLDDGSVLFTHLRQPGAAIYVGPRASADDLAWAADYDTWQLEDNERRIDAIVKGTDAGTRSKPTSRTLAGLVLRASEGEPRGLFPWHDDLVQQALALGEAEGTDDDAWVLVVGAR